MSTLTREQFLKDVGSHEVIVLRDDGVYRHIRFKRPGTGCMHFDLLTWPGSLCYTGDMGTFVFSRLHDMFQFFRSERGGINPQYWSEKVQAEDRCGVERFSEKRFREAVREHFEQSMEGNDGWSHEERLLLWGAIEEDVLRRVDDSEHDALIAVRDFVHEHWTFRDFWERNLKEYTHRFMWCCYALAWGIKQYDDRAASPQLADPQAGRQSAGEPPQQDRQEEGS
jgi:hypothetical protein